MVDRTDDSRAPHDRSGSDDGSGLHHGTEIDDAVSSSGHTVPCPFCQAPIGVTARKCRHCREWVARRCRSCNTPIRDEWAARGICHECQHRQNMPVLDETSRALTSGKSRTIAVVLALVLGGLGFHKFYMGRIGMGVLYFLFCWTGLPTLVGIIEGVRYIMMDDVEFERRYFG